ncbi:HTH_48 domain-containing protein [Trichonephila clavipes]|nr:HTH_48 domain-containing protein [Trichonephila clavipes]
MIYRSSPAVVVLGRPPPTFLTPVPVVWNAFQVRETTLLLIPNSADTLVTTPTQIKDELDSVYGDSAPSFTTIKFSAAEFKSGHKSLGDDERSLRPNIATTDENIAKVPQMELDDHRIKVREIAEIMNMS